jgi:hypothetical protein
MGGGVNGVPPITHTESKQKHMRKARHRAEPHRTPLEWRLRRWQNKWYAFTKPDLLRRYRALQSLTRHNVENYIKKLR